MGYLMEGGGGGRELITQGEVGAALTQQFFICFVD